MYCFWIALLIFVSEASNKTEKLGKIKVLVVK
jgi:hypothetical protein